MPPDSEAPPAQGMSATHSQLNIHGTIVYSPKARQTLGQEATGQTIQADMSQMSSKEV